MPLALGGAAVMADWTYDEPPAGSIISTNGPTGTAWQRHYSDGLWHSTTGLVLDWAGVVASTYGRPLNLVIHYQPEERA